MRRQPDGVAAAYLGYVSPHGNLSLKEKHNKRRIFLLANIFGRNRLGHRYTEDIDRR